MKRTSWTYKCKLWIMILFSITLISMLAICIYEVVMNREILGTVCLGILGTSIIPTLSFTLKWLLNHEVEKNKEIKKM